LNDKLADEDHEVRRIASCTIERTFVYVDVSDFSKNTSSHQALIINSLVYIVDHKAFWDGRGKAVQEAMQARMCLGDGYIFVFRNAMDGAYFAAYLAQLIETLAANKVLPVEFHFRMGVNVGEVYTFWDRGRRGWNYIGDGINGGNRVLSAIDKSYDDQVYISGQVRRAIMASASVDPDGPRLLANLHNRGRRSDKHNRPWRVYEIAHTALCAEDLPENLPEPPLD
jgi:class 3 adenylate cyclase